MLHMVREHAEPFRDALQAYGINPLHTPDEPRIRQTQLGIMIDQYVHSDDYRGGILCHEADGGRLDTPVVVRKFYPHPAPSDKWTVVPRGYVEDAALPGPRIHSGTRRVGASLHQDTIADALNEYFGAHD